MHAAIPHGDAAARRLPARLRALWAALLGFALLAPICVPYSLPRLSGPGLTGWSTSIRNAGGAQVHVVTSVMRHAAVEGVMTGDVLVTLGGEPVDSATIERAQLSARAGDTLVLGTLRRGDARVARVPVLQSPASLSAFFGFRVAIALAATVVALGILLVHAGTPTAWPLAAALVLISPTTFPAGVPGGAWWAEVVRWAWQMLAAAYRFGFPLLIGHFLVLHTPVAPALRSRRLWVGMYALGVLLLVVSTHGFTTPLAWTQEGPAKDIRLYTGALLRLGLLALALQLRTAQPPAPRELRWFADAVALNMVFSLLVGGMLLAGVEAERIEVLNRLHAIALFLIPVTAGLLLAAWLGRVHATPVWRRIGASLRGALTILYGLAVAGVAAVVLTSAGRSLDGFEWLLFLAIFLAAVLFSPVLRWSQELVDRRLFARRLDFEMRLATALDRIGKELEPDRITARIVRELPRALDAERVRLMLSHELAARLELGDTPHVEQIEGAALPRSPLILSAGTTVFLPIHDHRDGAMGALCIERPAEGEPFGAVDDAWQKTLTQGVAAALRNADTFQQLRRAQCELAESERIAATGALAAGLAHEIRNPLAALGIGLHMLEREGVSRPRLDRLLEQLQRIDDLVSTLLRGSAPARSDDLIDVGALLQERLRQLQPLAAHRGARLIARTPVRPMLVRGDREMFSLVISHLLRTAIDAVDEGGTIEARVESDGESGQLIVRDTARGRGQLEAQRIFELHRSTKQQGSIGLGLSRQEVELLGGAIEVESREDVGTTFRITLPVAR